ncbi:transporter [Salmonella enterica subsp. enterica serovar Typhimurium]|nr:transporter [Salmonella enterica subsp. enterica serovar Typhimurium]
MIVVWMPKYAMAFAGMAESDALKTISYYSMGSLVCVFIFAALLKKMVRPIWANVSMPGWRQSPLRQFTCIPLH